MEHHYPFCSTCARVSGLKCFANFSTTVKQGAIGCYITFLLVVIVAFNLSMSVFCSGNYPRSGQDRQSFDAVVKKNGF